MDSFRLIAIVGVVALSLGACTGETSDTTSTSTTHAPTTTTSLPEDPAVDGPVLRVGLTANLTSVNWWEVLDAESTPENEAIVGNTKTGLFTLTRPGFALVPALADGAPAAARQQGEMWVVEQPLREDVTWSDGEPVTADDLVFYFEVVRELGLGSTHAANFPSSVTDVSAPADHVVRVEFDRAPSVTDWQTGVGRAPFVPSHFWEPHVAAAREAGESARAAVGDEAARSAVAAESLADADPSTDLTPEQVTDADVESYRARMAAEAARSHLYSVESPREPSAGALVFDSWRPGEVAVTRSNPDFHARGTETTLYSDRSIRVARPSGEDNVYGGAAAGSVEAHHVVGPFISEVRWLEYEGPDEAYQALVDGQIDLVFHPDGMGFPVYNQFAAGEDIGLSISVADGFRFLGFNLRKPPMSDPVFRRAVATVINKELVASSVLGGTLNPAYTVIHPGFNTFHNPDVDRPGWSNGQPMGEGDRFAEAMTLLTDAGYTWAEQPEVVFADDGSFVDVVSGSGLEMPNGVPVPELTILAAPAFGDDPLRATFALWIAQWLTDLGMEVSAEPIDLESAAEIAIAPESTAEALAWDMHVLGWGRPNLSLPGLTLVALFHSRNRVEVGGLNSTGYSSTEFDAAADAFSAATTIEEAARWTREMERIISEDLPYVVLFRPSVIEAFGPAVEFPVDSVMGGHAAIGMAWPESVRLTR